MVHPFEVALSSFIQLVKKFELHFIENICPKSSMTMVLRFRQGEEETLLNFIARFTNQIQDIQDTHLSLVIQTFMIGFNISRLFWSLVERLLTIVSKVL